MEIIQNLEVRFGPEGLKLEVEMNYRFAGLQMDWKAICWLFGGLAGAVWFLVMWFLHFNPTTLMVYALIGVAHWVGGFCVHVVAYKHIEVDRKLWSARAVEDKFEVICFYSTIVSAAWMIGSYLRGEMIGWIAPLIFYLSAVWLLALAYRPKLSSGRKGRLLGT